jgi:WD40 repeat protein
LNESGLHFYESSSKKTYTQSLFTITNCGLAFNETGDMIAVADFGGTLHIFNTDKDKVSILPLPLFSVFVGAPIRSVAWCESTNSIAIGCVGGGLFKWDFGAISANFLVQLDHTINILRALDKKIYAGISDGMIKIFDSSTMELIYEFKAHHPINYDTEE